MPTAAPQLDRTALFAARAWLAAALFACALQTAPAHAQTITSGSLLVASPQRTDADLGRTVVLVLRHDQNGTIGIVLNRPTNVAPATVLPELAESVGTYQGRLFRGGPIAPTRLLYLVRGLAAATVNGPEVVEKVFLSIDDSALGDMVRLAEGTNDLRMYAGHVTWVPGQLQAEIRAGGWQVLQGTPELVFHEDPGSLWTELEGRAPSGDEVVAKRLP